MEGIEGTGNGINGLVLLTDHHLVVRVSHLHARMQGSLSSVPAVLASPIPTARPRLPAPQGSTDQSLRTVLIDGRPTGHLPPRAWSITPHRIRDLVLTVCGDGEAPRRQTYLDLPPDMAHIPPPVHDLRLLQPKQPRPGRLHDAAPARASATPATEAKKHKGDTHFTLSSRSSRSASSAASVAFSYPTPKPVPSSASARLHSSR